ncbi:MAG: heat-inducible transcriptional repressor HrcA [marine benthic group bacterium]|nr:heat-inducible transcriptional repressor HrcA [Gemmatimonadota bacterium]MCL7973933.1 heat-inducible transcriptional repressor HrcA [Gemmatimonadota bacterium]MCL7976572.1 heat-inducible transcriptional repressor HrcA [Gemmatimonadota bacterium]MCL7983483.1 heat-inducible transcriptional repressor HrcA [Gemmatimonadota bacterium]MCL7985409.1 heat-inducible transcriptional repressor HrcA [Gemmatimonadota bacterium]
MSGPKSTSSMKPGDREALSDREKQVLQAVVDAYIDSAEPAGSRRIVRQFELGVSPATVRNTMADLESKGFLTHPHTSAGRMPTDLAYRYYVDELMGPRNLTPGQRARLEQELVGNSPPNELQSLVQRAATVLGLLTGELGLSVGPLLAEAVLQRLDLVPVHAEKALLVLTLESGVVRTVYVDLPTALPAESLSALAAVLNERLAGGSLREIHGTLTERLRDIQLPDASASDFVNIFVQSGPEIFEWALSGQDVHLGSLSVLADQPEFNSGDRLRALMELAERRELLASVLHQRGTTDGPQITIGAEHGAPELAGLTIVTAAYSVGQLAGVVGVIGPTRMPYEKIVAVVDTTSSLVSSLLDE